MKSIRSYDIIDDGMVTIEMHNWCVKQFGHDNIRLLYRTLYFNREEDYTWFMLRWS